MFFNSKTQEITSYLFYIQWTLFNVFSVFLNKIINNYHGISSVQSLWIRSVFVLLIMLLFNVKTFIKNRRPLSEYFRIFSLNVPREIFGLISILLLFQGSARLYINDSILFSFLVPFVISLFSAIFLKEKINLYTILILIASFSVILLIYPIKSLNQYHLMLLGFVFARSACYILTKKNSAIVTVNSMIVSASLIYFAILSFFVSNKIFLLKSVLINSSFLFMMFFLAICYIGYTYTLRVSLSLISKITYLQPLDFLRIFESFLISYFLIGEAPSVKMILGSIFIIGLNVVNIVFSYKKK